MLLYVADPAVAGNLVINGAAGLDMEPTSSSQQRPGRNPARCSAGGTGGWVDKEKSPMGAGTKVDVE